MLARTGSFPLLCIALLLHSLSLLASLVLARSVSQRSIMSCVLFMICIVGNAVDTLHVLWVRHGRDVPR